jgi:hypothetical protein
MRDGQGRLWPEDRVKESDKLVDQTVSKIIDYAEGLSAQIGRFKAHTFDDINTTQDLLRESYGVKKGGKKGNLTYTSFDGLKQVRIQNQDHMEFGPELQIAKELIDECITDWADGAKSEIRALVNHAFNVEKPGKVNREALFSLRRIQIEDARWKRAVQAINDSIQITGSATYVRIYTRQTTEDKWQPITIDLAAA